MSLFVIGIIGLVAISACWALAIVLFRVGPKGTAARRLAVLLVIEGVTLITAGFPEFALGVGEEFYAQNMVLGIALSILHFFGDALFVTLYPPFLALVLGTALTRPFTHTGFKVAIGVIAISLAIGAVLSYGLLDSGLGASLLYIAVMLSFIYALVASVHAWRVARPGIARSRAGLFAIAFGIRDVCWGFAYGASFWLVWTNNFDPNDPLFKSLKLVYALGTLLAVPLIAYGILRGLLFDIDLKIRWTIKQSTVAGIFVAVIFLISEGANQFLAEELGNLMGLLAAAVVMFFLAPLQRFADRIASAAMPNTENTPEYKAFRKLQVYETAVAEALVEGGISAKERALLNHLRESLGVTEADAEAIERELSAQAEPAMRPAEGAA